MSIDVPLSLRPYATTRKCVPCRWFAAWLLVVAVIANVAPSFGQSATTEPSIALRTELVTCDVNVQDRSGRYIPGLELQAFSLFEDDKRQSLAFFSNGDEPVTVGIVLDVSGSMSRWFKGAIEALRQFAETCGPDDEYFVVTCSDRPAIVRDFTRDPGTAFNSLALVKPTGSTTLVDAVMLALEKAQQGTFKRRAVIVISDGEDNKSRYSFEELSDRASEADVLVYSLGIVDFAMPRRGIFDEYDESWRISTGRTMLKNIAERSGGRAFMPRHRDQLREACIDIALELRSQYRLGYYPTRTERDGTYRRLRVTVDQPTPGKRWKVRSRQGYRAPAPQPGTPG